ncbi:MAG: amidohydrolase family protein [Acidobacteriaceae bacterium]|nr:amidohydrolase family protein [Acidobacteriaceae bacterium]MBV9443429.1 amidohydrolase family protein [Acidobacteriaceae bacterium]
MYKIDAHQHFWKYKRAEYGWIDERMLSIRHDFLPEDLRKEMASASVNGAISVQARQSLDETQTLLRMAEENDFIKAVVGWVPLIHPDLERLLPTVAAHPKLRAVRHILHDEADDLYMLRDDFNRGIGGLKPYHLAYDILIFERHLPQTIQFVDRHPEQLFVLDHLAKPRAKDGLIEPWAGNLGELARRPNVYCKISGLVTEADWERWTADGLRPYFEMCLQVFGPRRLMFGSDWPVCLVATSYQRWVETVSGWVGNLSNDEQSRIWSGTAVEAYRLQDASRS